MPTKKCKGLQKTLQLRSIFIIYQLLMKSTLKYYRLCDPLDPDQSHSDNL